MAISRTIGLRDIVLRPGLIGLGAAALVWASLVGIARPQSITLERIAERIVRGESYKAEELDRLVPLIEAVQAANGSRAGGLRAAAVVTARQAETAITDGRRAAIDERLEALRASVLRSLTAAPADPFLWMVLFWRDNLVGGFDPVRLAFLAMSYRAGPNEGWVGVRRSPLALVIFSRLTPALQEAATAEFAGLVESRFQEMPDILLGPGWGARDALLPRLAMVSEPQRKAFARALYRAGGDVTVPGIERPDERPWSR